MTVLRPAQTYGEGRDLIHVFGRSAGTWKRLRRGRPVIVHGDGSGLWVAGHLDDVARAFVGAAGNGAAFGRASNDLGFRRTPEGFVPVISEYDQRTLLEGRFLIRLRTAYSERAVEAITQRLRGTALRSVEGGLVKVHVRF